MMALASCTAMTIRIYSDGMLKSGKWPATTKLRKVGALIPVFDRLRSTRKIYVGA